MCRKKQNINNLTRVKIEINTINYEIKFIETKVFFSCRKFRKKFKSKFKFFIKFFLTNSKIY